MSGPTATTPSDLDRRSLAALVALAVAAFCYVTVETAPVGLLGEIADDLDVSQAQVGLLVTAYSVTVAVTTLPLVKLAGRVPRRPLLLALMAVMVVATASSAAASAYEMLFAARIATALSQAVFWGVVGPVAAGMFPVRIRGRVMAVVYTGGSIGPMLGVPGVTWLGQRVGWQAALLAIAAMGLVALGTLFAALPSKPTRNEHAGRGTTPDARRFALVLLTTVLAVAGFFAVYTYTSAFITTVAGMSAAMLGPLLLMRGVADFGGIAAGGILSDRDQRLAVTLPLVLLTAVLAVMWALGTSPWVAGGAIVLTGLAMGGFSPSLQNRIMEFAPGSTDTASAAGSVAFNIGIALGSSLGGLTLAHGGAQGIALTGAAFTAAAAVTSLLTANPARSRPAG
ncbi:MFS transporter [Glycomyces harbinensis]|uniref:MFS transporter, DHA1 family, inner membrane transport protein n=1 Tax=Glycomyces harbinensis TaxID=58114 RepID=A0A1G6QMU3_9ACTN|nr:MFS transporter [Glycomyces harbinensis]SDC93692.1 MFS transporter, DHA1 family, inner membrane transport protein [Glycomyces harbinensis]